jgi:GNAT superfamily N-acetyltransferase
LACLYVEEGDRGKGLASRLLQAVEKDCLKRGVAALESLAGRDAGLAPCVPVEFYLENGFYILRDDRRHPLVRLDMKSLADWREVAGHAINSITAKKAAPAKAPA